MTFILSSKFLVASAAMAMLLSMTFTTVHSLDEVQQQLQQLRGNDRDVDRKLTFWSKKTYYPAPVSAIVIV
jgi:hypothetical protein